MTQDSGPQDSGLPLALQTEDLDPEPAAWLAQRCELVHCPVGDPRFAALLPRASALIVRTYTQVTAALLDRAPNLKVVARAGVGLENIDLPAAAARGISVVHTPGANTRAVVEYIGALLADALRPRCTLDRPIADAEWHRIRRETLGARELNELTIGIWGFGRIGSSIARVAQAYDMPALYHDLLDIPEPSRAGARPVPLNDLLARSDILTIHVDGRAENRNILNAAALSRVKPSLLIINTSRGFVVDHAALAAFLRATPTARATLDVHDPFEPITADYPLLGLPNARLTPHLASGTQTAKRNMSWVVRDVWRVLSGESPEFPAR